MKFSPSPSQTQNKNTHVLHWTMVISDRIGIGTYRFGEHIILYIINTVDESNCYLKARRSASLENTFGVIILERMG